MMPQERVNQHCPQHQSSSRRGADTHKDRHAMESPAAVIDAQSSSLSARILKRTKQQWPWPSNEGQPRSSGPAAPAQMKIAI